MSITLRANALAAHFRAGASRFMRSRPAWRRARTVQQAGATSAEVPDYTAGSADPRPAVDAVARLLAERRFDPERCRHGDYLRGSVGRVPPASKSFRSATEELSDGADSMRMVGRTRCKNRIVAARRTSQWSPGGRRVYVRSEYTCDAGFSGASTSIIALTSTGDWIEAEHVRAGRGSVEHITHLRDAGLPDAVPAEVVSALAPRRLSITTARAAALAPLASEDVLEALQQVDAAAVRAWLTENGQRFTLNGDQIASLIRADVPQSVLQAMVGWAPQQNAGQSPGMGQEVYTTRSNTGGGIVVYGSAPAEAQPTSNGLYCNASGCYSENPYSGYNGYNGFVYSPYQRRLLPVLSVLPVPVWLSSRQ